MLKQKMTTKQKRISVKIPTMKKDAAYEAGWERFWQLGRELEKKWKTKKTSLEILREGRTH